MDNKFREIRVADTLAQPVNGKHPYIAPQCKVIPIEQTSLICTSVVVDKGSKEDDYEDKGDQEGDDFEVDLGF